MVPLGEEDLGLSRATGVLTTLLLAGASAAGALGGCGLAERVEGYFAVRFAPEKSAQPSETELSRRAVATFWEHFPAGRRERIPEITSLLTAAYLENPRHPKVALLLAHTHLWALSERDRQAENPLASDHAPLAERYFEEARRLAPDDKRIPGWLGAVKLAIGRLHQDERSLREGYYMLQVAARAWPEFNHFSAGYPLSILPAGDPLYRKALEHQWLNVDACFGVEGRKVDRHEPVVDGSLATTEGPRRVCWNSAVAPHNFEGFFLNMGDMVLKTGDAPTAAKLYRIAQGSEEYGSWPYRTIVESRLARIDELAQAFTTSPPGGEPEMMFTSPYNCMACHQR